MLKGVEGRKARRKEELSESQINYDLGVLHMEFLLSKIQAPASPTVGYPWIFGVFHPAFIVSLGTSSSKETCPSDPDTAVHLLI